MQNVLITGANRGIGYELARQYVSRGDSVVAGSRNFQSSDDLEKLAVKYPGQVEILQLDVVDEDSIERSRAIVDRTIVNLDILINNAAINLSGESLKSYQSYEAINLLRVNSIGPVLVTKGFLALLIRSGGPKVVNISSEAGSISKMTRFRGYYYYASKAALNMYTRAMALDPDLKGFIVVAMHPGWVKTDMGGSAAPLFPAESVQGMVEVIDDLKPEDSGGFFTWQGESYPW